MKNLFLLLMFAFAINAQAQQNHAPCGNTYEDQLAVWPFLQENIATAAQNPAGSRDIKYLPVHFHLTKNGQGVGRGSYNSVFETLCGMNNYYKPHDIQFYLAAHPNGQLFNENIANDGVFSNQSQTFAMQLQKHPNAINVFVVAVGESGSGQDVAAYYSPNFDWIVCEKAYMNALDNTMSHETGHFLSLMHTFWGWEGDGFTSAHPNWPIAPNLSTSGRPTERMNKSNCTVSGDGHCDTPADYFTGIGGCNYNGGALDPNSTPVVPMTNNIMSYFNNCNTWEFTSDQAAAMRADVDKPRRNYLDNTFQPVATEITTPTNLFVSPANNTQVPYYNDVTVEWQAVPGATHYAVDFDNIPNFLSPAAKNLIVTTNTLRFTDLKPNTKNYIRVRPFNMHATCAPSRTLLFLTNDTPLANREISAISEWSIAPNPISVGDELRVSVQANDNFTANVSLLDLTGRVLHTQLGMEFFSGNNTSGIVPTANLSQGVYFVRLQSGNSVSTKRIVLVD